MEGLTGRMPGVLIQQNTGAPGNAPSIKVRGLGSISAGNGPLVVIDGQPLNSGSQTNAGGLNQLNPNDIDKIDVSEGFLPRLLPFMARGGAKRGNYDHDQTR